MGKKSKKKKQVETVPEQKGEVSKPTNKDLQKQISQERLERSKRVTEFLNKYLEDNQCDLVPVYHLDHENMDQNTKITIGTYLAQKHGIYSISKVVAR